MPELAKDIDDYDAAYDFPYCPAFKQIGEHRGPFDLGLIPIGAYDPRWSVSGSVLKTSSIYETQTGLCVLTL